MVKMKKSELNYINNELKDIFDKKVIVTGANSGIGFAICDILLKKGAHVVMACRNYDKAMAAKEKLLENNPDGKINILLYNQSTVAGGYELSKVIISKHPDFYALILNAGLIGKKNDELYGGKIAQTIGVNYISTMAICFGLQEFLDKSNDEHRIIFQGSIVARKCKYKAGQLYKTNLSKLKSYNISKCGILNLFKYLRDSNSNPKAFYLYAEPGVSNTNIIRNLSTGIQKLGYFFLKAFFHSNYMGALGACYAACNYVANGDAFAPKGPNRVKGLPKLLKVNKEMNKTIISDGKHILGEINGARW